ncbi:MAG: 1,4-alpha-glucan branching protein, partial [Pirellulaceae bacterium]|nr:1,4-alpha-glucan branching protein [Pirellulaceae bacterium]
GPQAFKRFVKDAHAAGFAVVLDVVYNHFGPSALDIWQFDGWSENGKGGIYFYNDHRSATPWGDTRPDYGRGEVRQYIHDNALMWLDDYHVDGLRYDMTLYIRSIDGSDELPEGWGLTQWINRTINEKHPNALTIAEDLQKNDYLTKPTEAGGAGFGTQWDAGFVHPVREVLTCPDDIHRSMTKICDALHHTYNNDVFQRVVYTESHDEVANGKSRVPAEVAPGDEENYFAQKLSALGAGLVMTAPGIPMLFQGQEFLQGGWFDDTKALDWENCDQHGGIFQLYSDLIQLRLNRLGNTAGLTGQHLHVSHCNDQEKIVAFQRRLEGGPGDDTVVVLSFSGNVWGDYRIGFPSAGKWRLRFCSDSRLYSEAFDDQATGDCQANDQGYDGMPASGSVRIGPYSIQIFSQDP